MKVLFEPINNPLVHPIGAWVNEQSKRRTADFIDINSAIFDTTNVYEQCLFQLLEGVVMLDERPVSTMDCVQPFQIDQLVGVIILSPTGDTIIVSSFYDPLQELVRAIIAYSGSTDMFAYVCEQLELDTNVHLPQIPYYINEGDDHDGLWYQTRFEAAKRNFDEGDTTAMMALLNDAIINPNYVRSNHSEWQALAWLNERDGSLLPALRDAHNSIIKNVQGCKHTRSLYL